ncbi:MAG TPA: (Fe-S)-binding protein [Thermodesulfobacteriota bacterium]|nr:(Fe-S)-binding protein [Deltaproteobacteria bacterium]HNU72476.1 (Fe-S)-binding protein [Thermodesulfobacteriota bacterium]
MTAILPEHEAGRCMKCGFCMSSCPVYAIDHIESHVARGRNVLVLLGAQGDIIRNEAYRQSLSYCLVCGRCQATCPAKISSADITVQARSQMAHEAGLTGIQRFVYRGILKHRSRMAILLGLMARIPGMSTKEGRPLRHLADAAALFSRGLSVPRLSKPFLGQRIARRTVPPPGVKIRGTVAVFPGCAFEFFFADAGKDIVATLAQAGFEVIYSSELTCCGLAIYCSGDDETARLMAQTNMDALGSFDRIITGCATCSSALKKYGSWFCEEDPRHVQAVTFSRKVQDFSEFLVQEGFQPQPASQPDLVTYHDPCHLRWHQGVTAPPRKLLTSLERMMFVEMEGADACCGLGGAFGMYHRDISLAIQVKKIDAIRKTRARIVATSCPGCMIQLMDGCRRHHLPVTVLHISQVLQGRTG